MKIAVLGATGATGQAFIQQALAHSHTVTALARNPQKLTVQHPSLTVIEGEALSYDDVLHVAKGQDAIFVALGGGNMMEPTHVRTDGSRYLIQALTTLGETPHVVVVSSLGAGNSEEQMPLANRQMVRKFLGNALADHDAQEALVQASKLPWTILRPAGLNNEKGGETLRVSYPPEAIDLQKTISRADVAAFALNVIETHGYVQQAVTLTFNLN